MSTREDILSLALDCAASYLKEQYGASYGLDHPVDRERITARFRAAPPTYADAEAKGFARGIETAATLAARFTSPRSGVQLATMIRSLASPAPKGET